MYTFSLIVGNIIPKSVKCIHSATKGVLRVAKGWVLMGHWVLEKAQHGLFEHSECFTLLCHTTQALQYPLIKEYTLNRDRIPNMILGTFIN